MRSKSKVNPDILYDEIDVGASHKDQLLYFYLSSHISMTMIFNDEAQAKRSWEAFRRAKNRANIPVSISLIENRVYFIKDCFSNTGEADNESAN